MMEKGKSLLLGLLVALSLVQSYILAYSMPSLETKVKTEQDYVQTEPLGPEEKIENMLFPEEIVLHLGGDKHTVFYPDNAPYYGLILGKLKGRDFKAIQRNSADAVDWNQVRREDQGIELRFGRPVPFDLLKREFKIDADFLFSRDSIDRIWIFVRKDSEEVRTFFFSSDGRNVYESQKADLTVGDMATNVGFGQYWTPFSTADGELYVPEKPYGWVTEIQVPVTRFTIEQMQRNLFFDPGKTRAVQERKDGNLYTDGQRSLQTGENGSWMTYIYPVAPTDNRNDIVDNVTAAVQFVNEHGGWNGEYRLSDSPEPDENSVLRFQQYFNKVPIVPGKNMTFGYMQLKLQQGTVTTYERSLLIMGDEEQNRQGRMLPGGETLRSSIVRAGLGSRVLSLFPAYRPTLDKDTVTLHPVWAVRLANGTVQTLAESYPVASSQ